MNRNTAIGALTAAVVAGAGAGGYYAMTSGSGPVVLATEACPVPSPSTFTTFTTTNTDSVSLPISSRFNTIADVYFRHNDSTEAEIEIGFSGAQWSTSLKYLLTGTPGGLEVRAWDANTASYRCDGACPTYVTGRWYRIKLDALNVTNRIYQSSLNDCVTQDLTVLNPDFRALDGGLIADYRGTMTISTAGLDLWVDPNTYEDREYIPNCHPTRFVDCDAPRDCAFQGLDPVADYQECPEVNLCTGQPPSKPPQALLSDFLFPTAHAIKNGRIPVENYGTVQTLFPGSTPEQGLGCTGTIIGPHEIATAAHCSGDQDGTVDPERRPAGRFYRAKDGTDTVYQIYRTVSMYQAFPNEGAEFNRDFSIDYTLETLPPPYIEIFDPAADPANCTAMISQGYSFGLFRECEVSRRFEKRLGADAGGGGGGAGGFGGADGQYLGYCQDPENSSHEGGDSGGPDYAIGTWGSDPRLVSVQSGSQIWNRVNSFQGDSKAFYDTNVQGIENVSLPIATLSNGAVIKAYAYKMGATTDTIDISSGATLNFGVVAAAGGTPLKYVGVTIENTTTGYTKSCKADAPTGATEWWDCSIDLIQEDGNGWRLSQVFATTTDDDTQRVFREAVRDRLSYDTDDLRITGGSGDTTPPVMTSVVQPYSYASVGGTIVCPFSSTRDDESGIETVACRMSDAADTNMTCAGKTRSYPLTSARDTYECHEEMPAGVDAQGLVYRQALARNPTLGYTQTTPSGYTNVRTYDCAATASDISANDGWGPDLLFQPDGVGGAATFYDFYFKASSNSIGGAIYIDEDAVMGRNPSDLAYGIIIQPTGQIQVLDGGLWVSDNDYFIDAGAWYRVHMYVENETSLAGGVNKDAQAYTVEIARCGNELTQIKTGAKPGTTNKRYIYGMRYANAFSDGPGQTIEVVHVEGNRGFCAATIPQVEPQWECGSPPNGCGDYLAIGDTCTPPDVCGPDFTCGPFCTPTPEISASSGAWVNSTTQTTATDQLTITGQFMVDAANGLFTVAATPVTTVSQPAMLIRFTEDATPTSGFFEARNGPSYQNTVRVDWTAGTWYDFRIEANVPLETYNVWVGECGQTLQQITSNYLFRDGYTTGPGMTNYALWHADGVSATPDGTTNAYSVVWDAVCTARTCADIGADACGQPSDFCGGTLDCDAENGGDCETRPGGTAGDVCTAGNLCCTPGDCSTAGPGGAAAECGFPSDGCGGQLSCGSCTSPEVCQGDFTCGAPSAFPSKEDTGITDYWCPRWDTLHTEVTGRQTISSVEQQLEYLYVNDALSGDIRFATNGGVSRCNRVYRKSGGYRMTANRSHGCDYGALVEDTHLTAGTGGGGSAEMLGNFNSAATFRRMLIWTGSKDIYIGTAALMYDTHFDIINNQFESAASHSDGIQVAGGCGPFWFYRNTMLSDPVPAGSGPGQVASNASIFMKGRWSNTVCPSIYSAYMDSNYFSGGIVTARLHSDTAGHIINNRWSNNTIAATENTSKYGGQGSACSSAIGQYTITTNPSAVIADKEMCYESGNNIAEEDGEDWDTWDNDCEPSQKLPLGSCPNIEPIPTTTISGQALSASSCIAGQAACDDIDISANVATTEGPRAQDNLARDGALYDSATPGGSFRWRFSCGGSPANTTAQHCAVGAEGPNNRTRCNGYHDDGADLWYHYPLCDGQASCTMTDVCDFQTEGAGTYTVKVYAEAGPGAAFRPSDHKELTFTVN